MASRPIIVAHRGASCDAPENTLQAFELAWEQGADAIEADLHLTRDQQIACLHDPDLPAPDGSRRTVSSCSLEELRALGPGSPATCVPLLAEVLATVPEGKRIYLEVKAGPELIPALDAELRRNTLEAGQIIVISFNQAVIRAWKERRPDTQAFWLLSPDRRDPLLADRIVPVLREIGADGLSCDRRGSPDESFHEDLRRYGFSSHVWTVNDADEARRFRDARIDSITTDRPAAILRALEARP